MSDERHSVSHSEFRERLNGVEDKMESIRRGFVDEVDGIGASLDRTIERVEKLEHDSSKEYDKSDVKELEDLRRQPTYWEMVKSWREETERLKKELRTAREQRDVARSLVQCIYDRETDSTSFPYSWDVIDRNYEWFNRHSG